MPRVSGDTRMGSTRRSFTEEYKAQAVVLVADDHRSSRSWCSRGGSPSAGRRRRQGGRRPGWPVPTTTPTCVRGPRPPAPNRRARGCHGFSHESLRGNCPTERGPSELRCKSGRKPGYAVPVRMLHRAGRRDLSDSSATGLRGAAGPGAAAQVIHLRDWGGDEELGCLSQGLGVVRDAGQG